MTTTDPTAVTVYWRPGCPFCSRLAADLGRAGVTYEARNIWDDPEAAAFVRSVARGNETVPTVTIGPDALVNPRVDAILQLLQELSSMPYQDDADQMGQNLAT